ncbi:molybdate ABC transporter permease protein ModB [Rodentibacter pneumotropicus]|uniref:Molybdate ABC transporter permease protein ModB n=1 Tax=Rodentibacter pneumotropicus TaxID=758 RepID=A0A3S4U884_9PAST|nr:molybdate ABC transporter permease protein ModB [Rodentibacter pneumotropicus]
MSGIVHLPLVLPPVVIGYLLLVGMGRNGFIGQYLYQWFGVSFGFSWKGAVLASAVVAFPLVVRAIRLSLESIDIRLERAAQTLGASPWRVFLQLLSPCHFRAY